MTAKHVLYACLMRSAVDGVILHEHRVNYLYEKPHSELSHTSKILSVESIVIDLT